MFRVIGRNIRNILLCLFSVILLVTICLAGAVFIGAKAESEKIVPQIRNGDFESDRTGWTLWTAINGIAGQPDAEFKIVSNDDKYERKLSNIPKHPKQNTITKKGKNNKRKRIYIPYFYTKTLRNKKDHYLS